MRSIRLTGLKGTSHKRGECDILQLNDEAAGNEFFGKERKMGRYSKEYNKELCSRYPFLIPRNSFSGRKITEGAGYWPGSPDKIPEYDWEFTELDAMPDGWRKAFGEQLCEELKAALEESGQLEEYRILQIKEKYGTLRWYSYFPNEKVREVIYKYEKLSARTCICCGKPATVVTTGWISPYCDDCVPKCDGETVPVDEYYEDEGDDDE